MNLRELADFSMKKLTMWMLLKADCELISDVPPLECCFGLGLTLIITAHSAALNEQLSIHGLLLFRTLYP